MSNEFLKTIFHKKFINIDLKKVLKKVENLKIYKIVFFKSIFRNNIYLKKKKTIMMLIVYSYIGFSFSIPCRFNLVFIFW